MRGVRGCCVCGKEHRAAEKHKPVEVTLQVREIKQKVPGALIKVDDLYAVVQMCTDDRQDDDDNPEIGVHWAEE